MMTKNRVQQIIEELQAGGWTGAAIADEIGVTKDTLYRWKSGRRYPENFELVARGLEALKALRIVPQRKRYT